MRSIIYRTTMVVTLVLIFVLGFMYLFSLIASAKSEHFTVVSGEACDNNDGTYGINWNAVTWNTEELGGLNDNILVEKYVTYEDGVSGWEYVTTGKFTNYNRRQFSGSFNQKGQVIQLKATAMANWGNGRAGGQSSESGLKWTGDCNRTTSDNEVSEPFTISMEFIGTQLDMSTDITTTQYLYNTKCADSKPLILLPLEKSTFEHMTCGDTYISDIFVSTMLVYDERMDFLKKFYFGIIDSPEYITFVYLPTISN